jgi:UDPglucose 6-dehydrogenase
MNEIANICSRVGANIDSVRKGIGSDARIGSRFLFAGLGYGGSCFPKDVKAVMRTAEDFGYDFRIIRAVEEVNEDQKKLVGNLVKRHFGEQLAGKHFAIWGLSFKPNTDDMREAPALAVIDSLLSAGATVTAFDPEAIDEAKRHYVGDKIAYAETPMDALDGADALLLLTEWNEFRRPDFDAVKARLRQPVVFDGRNIYSRKTLEGLGFTYFGIGT